MKTPLLFVVLLWITVDILNAQTAIIQVKPVNSETWKYADIHGNIIIDCAYPVCYPFSADGIAVAYYPRKNHYVLINSKGAEIQTEIQGFYLKDIGGYNCSGYSDGLIPVRISKKWGCLDAKGNVAVPIMYDELSVFSKGFGIGKSGNINFVVNSRGEQIQVKADAISIRRFEEYLAPFVNKEGLFGYIDTTGAVAIPALYQSVGYFYGGLAWAKNTKGLFGFINKKGEWVIPPKYTGVKNYDPVSGMALMKSDLVWLYVNENGQEKSYNISEITDEFHEGLSLGRTGGTFGFFNSKGEWVVKPVFEGLRDIKNGYAAAKMNGLWGIIDINGNWVMQPTFRAVKDVEMIKE